MTTPLFTFISKVILLNYEKELHKRRPKSHLTTSPILTVVYKSKKQCTHFHEGYLVVYLDLRENVVVSQCINQSLNSCTSDEVGFQVQTLQRLVRPQHVTEGLE